METTGKTYDPRFTEIYHELITILETQNKQDSLQQFKAYFHPYIEQRSMTERGKKECLESQIILRKMLEETYAYGPIYEFYYTWKAPVLERRSATGQTEMTVREINALKLGFSWVKDYDTVVECGSGEASLGLIMAQYNKKWVATDVYIPGGISGLMKSFNTPEDKFEYIISDASKMDNIAPESVDVIISQSLFEHFLLHDAIAHIKNAYDRLKDGGKLIIAVPSSIGPAADITRQFPQYDKPVGFHIKEYNAKDMYELLKAQGFKKVRFKMLRSKRLGKMSAKVQMLNYVPYAIMRPCELFALALYWPFRKNMTYRKIWMKVFYKLGFASTMVLATK